MAQFELKHQQSLLHDGMCYILGITPDAHIFIEEYYDETFIAQHQLTLDGTIISTRDEVYGKKEIIPFDLPSDCAQPQRPSDHVLNHTGFRRRGLRETDKVAEWVQPLPIMDKMQLLKALNLSIPAMMILGIAESKVTSATTIADDEMLICREVHLLQALPQIEHDADGLPYNYDTIQLNIVYPYHTHSVDHLPLQKALTYFPQIKHPMNCLYFDNHLIITENSHGDTLNKIHIYQKS